MNIKYISLFSLTILCALYGTRAFSQGVFDPVQLNEDGNAKVKVLFLEVSTANDENAGTDANISLAINWSKQQQRGRIGMGRVISLKEHSGSKYCIVFTTPRIPLRRITGMTLINGMDKSKPGWKVQSLRILVRALSGRPVRHRDYAFIAGPGVNGHNGSFEFNEWLDTKKDSNALAIPIKLEAFHGAGAVDTGGLCRSANVVYVD